MKTTHFPNPWLCGLACVLAMLCGATVAEEDSTTSQAADQIVQGSFLTEPILWVGERSPSELESRELLDILNHLDQPDWAGKLEQFIEGHPTSPWVPALRNALAAMYRRTGRYTPALKHWEAGWGASKQYRDGNGKLVADVTLVNWLGLLSSLGQTETIPELPIVAGRWRSRRWAWCCSQRITPWKRWWKLLHRPTDFLCPRSWR